LVLRRVHDDAAKREIHAGRVPVVLRDVEAAQLWVQVGDPKASPRRVNLGKAAREEGAGGGKPVDR
jgi:hypothetical protein